MKLPSTLIVLNMFKVYESTRESMRVREVGGQMSDSLNSHQLSLKFLNVFKVDGSARESRVHESWRSNTEE